MPSLTYTVPGYAPLDLNSHNGTSGILFLGMDGDGIPELDHQTVVTPNRDGETYVRTTIPPRFPIAHFLMQHTTRANLYALRRTVISALNPKLGVGTLAYTPVDGGTVYHISALPASAVPFDSNVGPLAIEVKAPFRCPQPGWLVTVAPLIITIPTAGLTVPLVVPIVIAANSITTTITNAGDLDAYPEISIDGPFSGPVLTNTTTGKYVAFPNLQVAAGSTFTYDMAVGTADVDGTNVMAYRSAGSQSWPLVKGGNNVKAETSTGHPPVTISYETAYLGI